MSKYGVSWDKSALLGVASTSVNVGRYNLVIVEAKKKYSNIILTGYPCHITHNASKKATDTFSKSTALVLKSCLWIYIFTLTTRLKEKIVLLNSLTSVTRTITRF